MSPVSFHTLQREKRDGSKGRFWSTVLVYTPPKESRGKTDATNTNRGVKMSVDGLVLTRQGGLVMTRQGVFGRNMCGVSSLTAVGQGARVPSIPTYLSTRDLSIVIAMSRRTWLVSLFSRLFGSSGGATDKQQKIRFQERMPAARSA